MYNENTRDTVGTVYTDLSGQELTRNEKAVISKMKVFFFLAGGTRSFLGGEDGRGGEICRG